MKQSTLNFNKKKKDKESLELRRSKRYPQGLSFKRISEEEAEQEDEYWWRWCEKCKGDVVGGNIIWNVSTKDSEVKFYHCRKDCLTELPSNVLKNFIEKMEGTGSDRSCKANGVRKK